jgi:hypothetical protein
MAFAPELALTTECTRSSAAALRGGLACGEPGTRGELVGLWGCFGWLWSV